jgi:hypothetical protein
MNWKEWEVISKAETLWQNHEEKGLLKAEYVDGYVLRLWFEEDLDVSIYELDFYPLIVDDNPGGIFEVLKDRDRFRLVAGDYSLVWLNPETGLYDEEAIDLAPESIRFFCEKYGKKLKVVLAT